MMTLPAGLIFVVAVLYYSMNGVNIENFLNMHSFVIVIVGTFAALMLSAPGDGLKRVIHATLSLIKKKQSKDEIFKSLHMLAEDKNAKMPNEIHELVTHAQDMWEQGVDPYLFEEILGQRLDDIKSKSEEPISILKNLAKYPPALGMMGTVMGMVSLFANLNSDNKDMVGANLALAMTATFYGLLAANLFITPLSDRLMVQHIRNLNISEFAYNILIFINRNEPIGVLEDSEGKSSNDRAA